MNYSMEQLFSALGRMPDLKPAPAAANQQGAASVGAVPPSGDSARKAAVMAKFNAMPQQFMKDKARSETWSDAKDRSIHGFNVEKLFMEHGWTDDEIFVLGYCEGIKFASKFIEGGTEVWAAEITRVRRKHDAKEADERAGRDAQAQRLTENARAKQNAPTAQPQRPANDHSTVKPSGAVVQLRPVDQLKRETQPEAWPELKPLIAPMLPVPAFNAEKLLPEALRGYVVNSARQMSAPPDFAATALLASLASLVGFRLTIIPKQYDDSWIVAPCLSGVAMAPPSSKKSPGIAAGTEPLKSLADNAQKHHKEGEEKAKGTQSLALKQAKKDLEKIIKAKLHAFQRAIPEDDEAGQPDLKAYLRGDPDIARVQKIIDDLSASGDEADARRYCTNDATVEKVAELAIGNPILVEQDELLALLNSFRRKGHESARQFYLTGYNGTSSYQVDRIGRGSIYVPTLCISVFGGTQPDKLAHYINEAATENDGFLARLQLMTYPDPVEYEWCDEPADWQSRNRVNDVFAELNALAAEGVAASKFGAQKEGKLYSLRFDQEAQAIFRAFSERLEGPEGLKATSGSNAMLVEHFGKYERLMASLALIFHLVDVADKKRKAGPVSKEAAERAVAWCEYLSEHAKRVYGMLKTPEWRAAYALRSAIEEGKFNKPIIESGGFTRRNVTRLERAHLMNSEIVEEALEILEENGYLRGHGNDTGRKTRRYEVNPAVKREESESEES